MNEQLNECMLTMLLALCIAALKLAVSVKFHHHSGLVGSQAGSI